MIRIAVPSLLCCLVAVVAAAAADRRVPQDYPSLAAAVSAARSGDRILLGAGEFAGKVTLDRRLTLRGQGRDVTRIAVKEGHALTLAGQVVVEGIEIQGGESCVHVAKGGEVTIRYCRLANGGDGLGFKPDFDTSLICHHNEFVRCGDAIDLEGNQALIYDNVFLGSKDDAIDYDGDAGALVYRNTIRKCGDDGIEIRLRRITNAVIVGNTIEDCGEDGVELIDTTEAGKQTLNCVTIARNTFRGIGRHGVGGVDQKTEEPGNTMVAAALFGDGNGFEACAKGALSRNLQPVHLARDWTRESVEVSVSTPDRPSMKQTLQFGPLWPLAVYDLRAAAAPAAFSDGEGVTVYESGAGLRALIGDDNTRKLWELDLRGGRIARSFSTHPFRDSELKVTGPEGVDVIRDRGQTRLWLADDEGRRVVVNSLAENDFGAIVAVLPIGPAMTMPEGLERLGNILYVAGAKSLTAIDLPSKTVLPGYPVSFGGPTRMHFASVGEGNGQLFLASSGYHGKPTPTQGSFLIQFDPRARAVTRAWSLGAYTCDARGVALHEGLVYVVDGFAGKVARGNEPPALFGQKLFVFARRPPRDLGELLPLLPLRKEDRR